MYILGRQEDGLDKRWATIEKYTFQQTTNMFLLCRA